MIRKMGIKVKVYDLKRKRVVEVQKERGLPAGKTRNRYLSNQRPRKQYQ